MMNQTWSGDDREWLNLPAALVQLLRAGRWKRPPDVERLAAMTGVQRPDDFTFLDPDGMIRETAAGLDLVRRGQGTIYGLVSTSDAEAYRCPPDFLDAHQSVVLAVNWDEEVICLDYRSNSNEPTVVVSAWPGSQSPPKWKLIAATFDEFARQLGL
jgi:hypothetical protein